MPHIYSHKQTPTPTAVVAVTAASRKLANKERRKVGREVRETISSFRTPSDSHADTAPTPNKRHEERKEESKAHEFDRKWEVRHERDAAQRQGKRREDGTRAFTGRNTYNQRKALAGALHVRATDIITTTTTAVVVHRDHHVEEDSDSDSEDAYAPYDYDTAAAAAEEEEEQVVRATSGAMLLAMARPAKTRTRRHPPVVTDGEMFEIVEIDGRLVALDEDGWEILPDENAEVSLLYSDIVRGSAL